MIIRLSVVNRPYTYMDGRTNIYKGVHVLSVHKSGVVLFEYLGRWKKNKRGFLARKSGFRLLPNIIPLIASINPDGQDMDGI